MCLHMKKDSFYSQRKTEEETDRWRNSWKSSKARFGFPCTGVRVYASDFSTRGSKARNQQHFFTHSDQWSVSSETHTHTCSTCCCCCEVFKDLFYFCVLCSHNSSPLMFRGGGHYYAKHTHAVTHTHTHRVSCTSLFNCCMSDLFAVTAT